MKKNKDFYLNNIADLAAIDIIQPIRLSIVTFDELRETGNFIIPKQREVKKLLADFSSEDSCFNEAINIDLLRNFLINYPDSIHADTAKEKLLQLEADSERMAFNNAETLPQLRDFLYNYPNSTYGDEARRKIEKIEKHLIGKEAEIIELVKRDVNFYKPDELKKDLGLSEQALRDLCNHFNIDFHVFANFDEPYLNLENAIPASAADVPQGFTDVFFWGIPGSGKTTALSVIFRTMKDKFTIANANLKQQFGAAYRDQLTNIFTNKTAYLPAATQKDRTQYMPFLLKKRGEDNYRQISFFELSGEVFRYLYEREFGCNILDDDIRKQVENAFPTLELLLNSNNQKIHFFFIDYKRETERIKDEYNLTQENYLDAAATFFRNRLDLFRKKTDAVYVVVTKADEIKEENIALAAKQFLETRFGSFMEYLKNRCKKDSIDFNVKVFSIGDVYFKSICTLKHNYAENIINDLVAKVKPVKERRIITRLNS